MSSTIEIIVERENAPRITVTIESESMSPQYMLNAAALAADTALKATG